MSAAEELFELVSELRDVVEEAYAKGKWANDDQFAKSYNRLAKQAGEAFPSDPAIGELQVSIPPELSTLVTTDPSCLTTWVRMQLGQLATRLSQHARRSSGPDRTLIDLDLRFMRDDDLRNIVVNDFMEAQRSFYADAPKAAALLCGSVIEGMLLDVLRRPEVEEDERFGAFLKERNWKELNWDHTSLTVFLGLAQAFKLIRPTTSKMAEGARDFRDTVHAAAEARSGSRAGVRDANLLMQIVELLAYDLRGQDALG